MEVIYSKQVLSSIEEYTDALTKYPISDGRIQKKVDDMFNALQSIGANPLAYPICQYQALGQSFFRGKPKNPYLRQFVYKDKADKPWTFAYIVDERQQRIYITSMIYSAFIVKESPEVKKILSLMERMENLN